MNKISNSDFIGFLVVVLFLLTPLLRKLLKDAKTVQKGEGNPLSSKNIPKKKLKSRKTYVTQRILKPQFEWHSSLEQKRELGVLQEHHLESNVSPQLKEQITSDAFEEMPKKTSKKGPLSRLPTHSLHAMVISSELLRTPKAFEDVS